MVSLKLSHRSARPWTENSVGRNAEGPLQRFDRSATAPDSKSGACIHRAPFPCERCLRLSTDDPINNEPVALLERPDGRTGTWAEDAIRGNA
jgi:hypothetical protein